MTATLTPTDINLALLLTRVVFGVTLALHGYNKFFRGGRIPGTAGWFDSIGMKPGKVHALAAASTELGSGILLALGLLTPLAAAGFVGVMAVAAWTVHRPNFFITKNGWEFNMVLATAPVTVAIIGPGDWSLDHALGWDAHLNGATGLLLSAALGGAGAIALLATCFRPPATTGE